MEEVLIGGRYKAVRMSAWEHRRRQNKLIVVGEDTIGMPTLIQLGDRNKIVAMFTITSYKGCPL